MLNELESMNRPMVATAAILAFLAVAAGAFGAHGLREYLGERELVTFDTAVRYQMVHALALLFVGLAAGRDPTGTWVAAAWLFVAGTIVFSGSLYLLALTGTRWLGAVTPVGGLCFLAAWICVVVATLRTG